MADEKKEIKSASTKTVEQMQAEHPNYKWFDEFEFYIQKANVHNRFTNRAESIITGFQLTQKRHAKFITSENAKLLNMHAAGAQLGNIGLILLPKDKHTMGETIPYKQWADEQGIDPENDINILLTPKNI